MQQNDSCERRSTERMVGSDPASKLELSFKNNESDEAIEKVVISTVFKTQMRERAKQSKLVQQELAKTCLIRQQLERSESVG